MDKNKVAAAKELSSELKYLADVIGLLAQDPLTFLKESGYAGGATQEWIEGQIAERAIARTSGNWGEADRIRDDLLEQGILLEDHGDGQTSWRLEEVFTGE